MTLLFVSQSLKTASGGNTAKLENVPVVRITIFVTASGGTPQNLGNVPVIRIANFKTASGLGTPQNWECPCFVSQSL